MMMGTKKTLQEEKNLVNTGVKNDKKIQRRGTGGRAFPSPCFVLHASIGEQSFVRRKNPGDKNPWVFLVIERSSLGLGTTHFVTGWFTNHFFF